MTKAPFFPAGTFVIMIKHRSFFALGSRNTVVSKIMGKKWHKRHFFSRGARAPPKLPFLAILPFTSCQ
jgi:hypothetical protein